MKIGIDVDGVLLDSERAYRTSAEIYTLDILEADEDRLIDKAEMAVEDRYGWTEDEAKYWHENYLLKDADSSNFMPGAVEVVKKLREMGHELYVITARGGYIKEMQDSAMKKFEEQNLKFDGYYFNVKDKGELCEKIGIDIMIDDGVRNCIKVCDKGIKVLYFRDVNMNKLDNELSVEVNNWGEIYKYFKINNKKAIQK